MIFNIPKIIDNLLSSDSKNALSAKQGRALNEGKADKANLTANGFPFVFDYQNGKYGYNTDASRAAATFRPFRLPHIGTFVASRRAANLDMGEDHTYRYVNTNNVPNVNSATYSVIDNGSKDMGETNNYRYLSVNIPNTNTGTYVATSRGSALDMGAQNAYRYVNTNGVPNSNSGTYNITSNGTKDMGVANTYRFANVNVTPPSIISSMSPAIGQSDYYQNAASGTSQFGHGSIIMGTPTVSVSGGSVIITIPETIRIYWRTETATYTDTARSIVIQLS